MARSGLCAGSLPALIDDLNDRIGRGEAPRNILACVAREGLGAELTRLLERGPDGGAYEVSAWSCRDGATSVKAAIRCAPRRNAGLLGRVLKERAAVVAPDIAHLRSAPYLKLTRSVSATTALALPLADDTKNPPVLEIYFADDLPEELAGPTVVALFQRNLVSVWERASHLAQSRELFGFKSAVEGAVAGIAITDPAGYLTFVNRALRHMWRVPSNVDPIGRHANSFWADGEVIADVTKALMSVGAWVGHIDARREDGSTFPAFLSTNLVTDDSGNPVCMMASAFDLSDIRETEKSLSRHQQVIEQLSEGIFISDLDGKVLDCNPATLRMLGFKRSDVIGMDEAEFLDDPEIWRSMRHQVYDDLAHGKRFLGKARFRLKDGSRRLVESSIAPLLDNEGNRIANIGLIRDVTEYHEMQRSVEENAKWFQALTDSSLDLINVIDPQGTVRFSSPSVTDILGYEEHEYLGGSAFDLIHPDDLPRLGETIQKIAAGNDHSGPTEFRARRKDGSWCELQAVARNLIDDPVIRGLLIVSREVTEQKEIARRLEESERRFRTLVERMLDVLLIVDAEGRFVFASPSIETVTGFTPNELIDMSAFERIHPDDLEELMVSFEDALRGDVDVPYFVDYRTRHKDGSWRWVESIAVNLLDDPVIRGIVVSSRDITDRKAVEEALRQSEASLTYSQRLARLGDFEEDLEKGTIRGSDEIFRIIGHRRGEVPESSEGYYSCVHDEDREDLIETVFHSIKTGRAFQHEHRVVRPGGEIRHVNMQGVMSLNAEGRTSKITGTIQDVTRQHRAEEQLRQAQKMEAVGNLTGGIAHDFNNLLTAILGNLEILDEKVEDSQLRRYIKYAVDASDRGAELTQHLLAFSRKQPLRPVELDISELIGNTFELYRRLLGQGIRFKTELDPSTWPVVVDRAQMEACLLNLMLNARDAMANGGTLTIAASNFAEPPVEVGWRTSLPGKFVRIDVRDDGHGMSPEVAAQAFEPFFTTKEIGEGSGLGLSMVHGFAHQSGGRVEIDSEVGRGTTVSVYLPARPAAQAAKKIEIPRRERLVDLPKGSETVLIVEDRDDVREIAIDSLESLGYRVVSAADAASALEILRSQQNIDLLFTDVLLAGKANGCELADRARAEFPDLRVLFTSGYAGQSGIARGLVDEAELLSKPYRRSELAQRLREVLSR